MQLLLPFAMELANAMGERSGLDAMKNYMILDTHSEEQSE